MCTVCVRVCVCVLTCNLYNGLLHKGARAECRFTCFTGTKSTWMPCLGARLEAPTPQRSTCCVSRRSVCQCLYLCTGKASKLSTCVSLATVRARYTGFLIFDTFATYVYIDTYIHVCMYVCIYMYVYVYMYMYICVYVYMFICTCIYMRVISNSWCEVHGGT